MPMILTMNSEGDILICYYTMTDRNTMLTSTILLKWITTTYARRRPSTYYNCLLQPTMSGGDLQTVSVAFFQPPMPDGGLQAITVAFFNNYQPIVILKEYHKENKYLFFSFALFISFATKYQKWNVSNKTTVSLEPKIGKVKITLEQCIRQKLTVYNSLLITNTRI